MTTVKHPAHPKPKSLVRREPAVTVGVITAVIAAAFGVATAFGLHLSDDQVKALVVFVGAVAPLVAGFVTRGKVTPVK